jgi:hypothetical protein
LFAFTRENSESMLAILSLLPLAIGACKPGVQWLFSTDPSDWSSSVTREASLDLVVATGPRWLGLRGSFVADESGEHSFDLLAQGDSLAADWHFENSVLAFANSSTYAAVVYKDFRYAIKLTFNQTTLRGCLIIKVRRPSESGYSVLNENNTQSCYESGCRNQTHAPASGCQPAGAPLSTNARSRAPSTPALSTPPASLRETPAQSDSHSPTGTVAATLSGSLSRPFIRSGNQSPTRLPDATAALSRSIWFTHSALPPQSCPITRSLFLVPTAIRGAFGFEFRSAAQSDARAGVGALGLALIGAAVFVALSLLIGILVWRSRRERTITAESPEELRAGSTASFEQLFTMDSANLMSQANPVVSTHWDECLFTNCEGEANV